MAGGGALSAPAPIPEDALGPAGGFTLACQSGDLLYFVLNVGDGDTQLILLPERDGARRALVVDVASEAKLASFLDRLAETPLLPQTDGRPFTLVVATHPHDDHIGGMGAFLERFSLLVEEVWEPGYYHTSQAYLEMMRAIEEHDFRHTQPTSGTTRFFGNVQLTVLTPGVGLRGRFDSYGIEINNSSIALKLDFPASRVVDRREDRTYFRLPSTQSIILGADAQTLSWAQALVDFPQLGPESTAAAKALRSAGGTVPLRAAVFKLPHHGSKHGVNLELVEAIAPKLTLVSSVGGGGEYNFPHQVAQDLVREGLEALAGKTSGTRSADHELGIHYTSAKTTAGETLGTIGLIVTPGGRRRMWRFMDRASERIDLARGREFG